MSIQTATNTGRASTNPYTARWFCALVSPRWCLLWSCVGLWLCGDPLVWAQDNADIVPQAVPSVPKEPAKTRGSLGDFDPASKTWNGLSRWMSQAHAMGIQVETPKRWDWSRAQIQVPIVVFAPQSAALDPTPLIAFVQAGGRVLLVDDFGYGMNLLAWMGLRGYRSGIQRRFWHPRKDIDLHRTFPRPGQEADFLLRQASFLFLNVPQWLDQGKKPGATPLLYSNAYRSTLPDRDLGGDVVFRVRRGWGRVVVVSDPSLFMNQMIIFGDNRRFTRNVLRYLTWPLRSQKLVLLWGDFQWKGRYQTKSSGHLLRLGSAMWEGTIAFNKALTSLPTLYETYPPQGPNQGNNKGPNLFAQVLARKQQRLYPYIANLALLALLVLLWLGWLRSLVPGVVWEAGHYDPEKEAARYAVGHRFQDQLENYQEGGLGYLWPVILLKEELWSFLMEHSGLESRLEGQNPRDAGAKVLRVLEEAVNNGELPAMWRPALPELKKLQREIPSRYQWNDMTRKRVTVRDLKRYYRIVHHCLHVLGLEDQFRQPLAKKKD